MRHLIHREKKVLTKEETTWGAPPYACRDIGSEIKGFANRVWRRWLRRWRRQWRHKRRCRRRRRSSLISNLPGCERIFAFVPFFFFPFSIVSCVSMWFFSAHLSRSFIENISEKCLFYKYILSAKHFNRSSSLFLSSSSFAVRLLPRNVCINFYIDKYLHTFTYVRKHDVHIQA